MLKQNGFTLIELMIVVVIVAILASVAIPNYITYTLETGRTDGQIALLDLADRQERYYLTNNSYADSLADLGGATTSAENYYQLAVTSGTANVFTITASAQNGQENDIALCRTLSYNQAGAKTPVGCWN